MSKCNQGDVVHEGHVSRTCQLAPKNGVNDAPSIHPSIPAMVSRLKHRQGLPPICPYIFNRDQHHHFLSLYKIPTSDEDPPLMTVVLARVRSSQPVIYLLPLLKSSVISHTVDNKLWNHNPRSLILIDCHYFSTLIRPR